MKNLKFKFFSFFICLFFIFCKNTNEEEDIYLTGIPFNISIYEVDKLMSCSVILKLKSEIDEKKINEILNKYNKTFSRKIERKILTDMYENCYNKIDNETIYKFCKNFNFINNNEYLNSYDKLFDDINYNNYNENSDLNLSEEQKIISYKFDKLKDLYEQKESKKNLYENKLKLGNYDINNIPSWIKGTFFIFIFTFFIFGILYFLNRLNKKTIKNKRKKK